MHTSRTLGFIPFLRSLKALCPYPSPRSRSSAQGTCLGVLLLICLGSTAVRAQVPALLNYQGRVGVAGASFDGNGLFKFALVNADASATYWRSSTDGDSNGEPDAAVTLPVSKGLFSVHLGDPSIANMAVLPTTVFNNSTVFLRVWFNDGVSGFQRLTPDQRIVSVGYSLMAAAIADGAVSMAKLAPDVTTALSSAGVGTVWTASQIPGLDASKIVSGVFDAARIPGSFATTAQIAALTAQVDSLSNRLAVLSNSIPKGIMASSADSADASILGLGYVPSGSLPAPSWTSLSTVGAPSARSDHSSVWAGDSWLIWGGNVGAGTLSSLGAVYRPQTDQWSAISTVAAPTARSSHTAVWTGTEMIVWGGFSSDYLNTGGRYNPSTLQWQATPTSGAPSGRTGHVTVWTGSRMLIWGGRNSSGVLSDGALYDPVGGVWSALNLPNAPSARHLASAVWTGTSLLVWGGEGTAGSVGTGAELVFGVDGLPIEWRTISAAGAPAGRSTHGAVWTGQKMIIWGGRSNGTFLGDGSMYDPNSNSWTPVSGTSAPASRGSAATVWTGSEMVVFGGDTSSSATASGGAYEPVSGKWRALSNGGTPVARSSPGFAWTGNVLLVFGGKSSGVPLASGQSVSPQPALFLFRKP